MDVSYTLFATEHAGARRCLKSGGMGAKGESSDEKRWTWIARAADVLSLVAVAIAVVGFILALAFEGFCQIVPAWACRTGVQSFVQIVSCLLIVILVMALFVLRRQNISLSHATDSLRHEQEELLRIRGEQDQSLSESRTLAKTHEETMLETRRRVTQLERSEEQLQAKIDNLELTRSQLHETVTLQKQQLGARAEIARRHRMLAVRNRETDAELFARLFWERLWIRRAAFNASDLNHLESAVRACNLNIAHNLDIGAAIFGQLTGDQCAVSIKTIKQAADGTLLTHGGRRDTTSRETRARVDDIDYVLMDNFAFRDIYLGHDQLWVCDNLAKAVANGRYKNPRPNFGNDYNATIVYPLYKMASSAHAPFSPKPMHTPIAFLCADNRLGGFCTVYAREYIVELAARLEVMSHRQRVLAELIDGVKSKTKELPHGREKGPDRPRSEPDVHR